MQSNADQNRRRWKNLHAITWAWVATFLAASVAVNVVYRFDSMTYGWPLAYADYVDSTAYVGESLGQPPVRIPSGGSVPASPPLTAFFGGPLTKVIYPAVVGDFCLCLGILLMSALAVEGWCNAAQVPRFRFRLGRLFVVITWIAVGCWLFGPSGLWPDPKLEIANRIVQWSLLIEFVGIGLALSATFDLAGYVLTAGARRSR